MVLSDVRKKHLIKGKLITVMLRTAQDRKLELSLVSFYTFSLIICAYVKTRAFLHFHQFPSSKKKM